MLSAAVACGELGPDFERVVAIEVSTPDSLEQFDTLRPRARALNGRGDSVAATILWATLDTLLAVVNETTGTMVGKRPGADARIQARVGTLRSNLILVDVLAAADTLVATGPPTDTVTVSAPDSLSDSLPVQLADTTAGGPTGLRGRPVVWAITAPTGGGAGSVTLVTNDTTRTLVTVDTVTTNASGIAAIQLRLISQPRPDSAIVEARAQRAVGTTIPGSPVIFVVRFLP